ncbi:MAG: response regulator [Roseiflexus sp.]|jgi:CheY-like chemotaxis protein|nr:response regulator [Roseiflexus sp.]MBO9335817.1 response regulator [Roseiflexus sp.]MBO9365909.1 response regulator [Roseiflexus sp.]MBO9389617.1 response regulator [Roseiflexus sp.]
MACVVCLSDTVSLVRAVREEIATWGHTLYPFPCSRLNDALRQAVRQASPDVILLELTGAIDNPHIYFFLRADQSTRNVPVIFLSSAPDLDVFADALGADGSLRVPFERSMLRRVLGNYLDVPHVVDTPRLEVPHPTIQRYTLLLRRPQLMTMTMVTAPPGW